MLSQYFFCINIHAKPSHPFKGKSIWTPPPCDNPNLIKFSRALNKTSPPSTPTVGKTIVKLTLQDKSTLNNLKNNQSIAIKTCDKREGICILNTKEYVTKIHKRLQYRNTYKPLTHNPKNAIVNATCTLNTYIPNTRLTRPPGNFYYLLKIPAHLSSIGYPKFTSQTAISLPLILRVKVQLTISLPTSTISSSP